MQCKSIKEQVVSMVRKDWEELMKYYLRKETTQEMTPECSLVSEQMCYGKEVKCSRKREINTQKKKVPWLGLGFSWSHSRVREAIPCLCCCRGCMREGLDRESQVISYSSSTDKHQLLNTHYGGREELDTTE